MNRPERCSVPPLVGVVVCASASGASEVPAGWALVSRRLAVQVWAVAPSSATCSRGELRAATGSRGLCPLISTSAPVLPGSGPVREAGRQKQHIPGPRTGSFPLHISFRRDTVGM